MIFLDYFTKQVENYPDQIAVRDDENVYTYADVEYISNYIASEIPCGTKVVAIISKQGIDMIPIIIGIMKSGAAFLVIDEAFPEIRIRYMLENCDCNVVIINNCKLKTIESNSISKYINYKPYKEIKRWKSSRNQDDIQYIVYTSGTTGKPKGVMLTDGNLENYLEWFIEEFKIKNTDKSLVVSSMAFDLCYSNIFPILAAGGEVNILSKDKYISPSFVKKYIIKQKITFMKCTPSYLNILLNDYCDHSLNFGSIFRLLVLGGENLKYEDVRIVQKNNPKVEIINHYGPTETTIGTVFSKITPDNISEYKKNPFIGKTIPNVRALIRTSDGNLHDINENIGKRGELCIQGKSTSLGYIKNSELTRKKFISDNHFGNRIYCTGDVVSVDGKGIIHIIGRRDSQIKINGYRIEIEEIKNVLLSNPKITLAEVNVENSTIVTYIKLDSPIEYDELYSFLYKRIPEYMIPKKIFVINHIEINMNGKIDYDSMKMNSLPLENHSKMVMPRTETEKNIYDIWKRLLKCDFGIDDDFFKLGGNSILSIELLYILNIPNFKFSDLVKNSTIRNLSSIVEKNNYSIMNQSENSLKEYRFKKTTLCKIKYNLVPFNDIYYGDCIFNAIFSAFNYYQIDLRMFLCNELVSFDSGNNLTRAKDNLEIDLYMNQVYELNLIKGEIIDKGQDVVGLIRDSLINEELVVLRLDCFFERCRSEFYNNTHFMHAVCIVGFDDEKQQFTMIEHSDVNSLDYKETLISYEEIAKANYSYGYFSNFNKKSFYKFNRDIVITSKENYAYKYAKTIIDGEKILLSNIDNLNKMSIDGFLFNPDLAYYKITNLKIYLEMEMYKANHFVNSERTKRILTDVCSRVNKIWKRFLIRKIKNKKIVQDREDVECIRNIQKELISYFDEIQKWANDYIDSNQVKPA